MEEYRHLDSPQGPPPSYHARWDDVPVEDVKNEDIKQPEGNIWVQRLQLARQRTMPMIENVHPYFKKNVIPAMKKMRITKRQACAVFLLVVFAVVPAATLFSITTGPGRGGTGPFGDKTLNCGQLFSSDNATVKGIQGLFVIDAAAGDLSFSLVKFIDVVWDLVVGRGVQLLAWYVSYVVFTDALLRVIERHPAPYRTFTHICLSGASLSSMGALICDMRRYRSQRSKWLFAYFVISIFYVLSLPTILSAMTGYVSTSKPFVTLRDHDSSQLVSMNDFIDGYQVFNGYKIGQPNGTCLDESLFSDYLSLSNAQGEECDCMLPNGTIIDVSKHYSYYPYYYYGNEYQCTYNYTNNTQQFTYPSDSYYYRSSSQNYSCNYLFNLTVDGHTYKFDHLNMTSTNCYNGTAYDYSFLSENSQCMPDTTHNTYMWGFSTMLSAVFVILQLIWACSMYVVWQDAQWNSVLVRGGYKMTQLRAAFSLSEAAQQRTGMENEELMRMESKQLEGNLYSRKTLVDYGMWERKKLPYMNENEASSSRS